MNRKQPFTSQEFKEIYSKATRLTVVLVIQNEKGILLTLRQKNGWEGKWHIPGGTVFYRESLEDAVKRVAREELKLEVNVKNLLGYIEYPSEVEERGFGYTVALAFSVKSENFNFIPDDQVSEANFFKTLPENIIQEEKEFLVKLNLI